MPMTTVAHNACFSSSPSTWSPLNAGHPAEMTKGKGFTVSLQNFYRNFLGIAAWVPDISAYSISYLKPRGSRSAHRRANSRQILKHETSWPTKAAPGPPSGPYGRPVTMSLRFAEVAKGATHEEVLDPAFREKRVLITERSVVIEVNERQ
jgi:hypothetical protein